MYLGRHALGDWLNVPLLGDARMTPTAPALAPSIKVFNAAGVWVLSQRIPAVDLPGATGLFCARLRLGSAFAVGRYSFVLQYQVAPATGRIKAGHFEVHAGGDADGNVIAMTFYQRPQASFLVMRLDSDQRLLARNPRL